MDHFEIEPSTLLGEIGLPASKSQTMRALIFASMAEGVSTIDNLLASQDTLCAIEALKCLGASFEEGLIYGFGGEPIAKQKELHLGGSGILLRFLTGLAAKTGERMVLKGDKTRSEVGSQFGVHPTQVDKWKQKVLSGIPTLFTEGKSDILKERDKLIEELYKQIGQLKVELDWLKKKMGLVR